MIRLKKWFFDIKKYIYIYTVYFYALDADTNGVVKNPHPSYLQTQMKQQDIIHTHFLF